jgi:hypothetical protein
MIPVRRKYSDTYFENDTGHFSWVGTNLGQCRVRINQRRTMVFYAAQPKISENCKTEYCKYFEEVIINLPIPLFECLDRMCVDLSRQPNIDPAGLICVGETKKGKIGYSGYYLVFGKFGKSQNKSAKFNADGEVEQVQFMNGEYGEGVLLTITKVPDQKLCFEFYLEVEKGIS